MKKITRSENNEVMMVPLDALLESRNKCEIQGKGVAWDAYWEWFDSNLVVEKPAQEEEEAVVVEEPKGDSELDPLSSIPKPVSTVKNGKKP